MGARTGLHGYTEEQWAKITTLGKLNRQVISAWNPADENTTPGHRQTAYRNRPRNRDGMALRAGGGNRMASACARLRGRGADRGQTDAGDCKRRDRDRTCDGTDVRAQRRCRAQRGESESARVRVRRGRVEVMRLIRNRSITGGVHPL